MLQLRTISLALVAGLVLVGPGAALADRSASGGEILVISDEIWGRSVDVEREDAGSGKSNNGHGNNADGVDSSNPGKGNGGPNGSVDQSCPAGGTCVDDEKGTGSGSDSGGAVDTRTDTGSGNGKAKGKNK